MKLIGFPKLVYEREAPKCLVSLPLLSSPATVSSGAMGVSMGRGEFVEIIRSNVLRIEASSEVEELLKSLQRGFKKYFDVANNFIKQYYRINHRLPRQIDVYRILREYGVSSTAANEVSKKVLEAWKSYFELEKRGFKAKPPIFRNIPVILHNQQYRVYARGKDNEWIAEKIEFSLNGKWVSLKVKGKLRWIPRLNEGLVFYISGLKCPSIKLRYCLIENYLVLGERCLSKNKAEIFQQNNKWYFVFSVSLKIPLLMLKGSGVVGIDVGVRNLVALVGVSNSGEAFSMLFKSGTLRAYWLKCEKLARRRQKIAYRYFWRAVHCAENGDREKERECFWEYRRFLEKAGRFKRKAREVRKKAVNQMAKLVAEYLASRGVSVVYVGNSVCRAVSDVDLIERIVSKPTKELLRGFFAPRQIIKALQRHCEVRGIRVIEIDEMGTSSVCPVCESRVERRYRGLVVCREHGCFNADLVAAFNILKRNTSVELRKEDLKELLNYPKTYVYLVKEQKWVERKYLVSLPPEREIPH